MSSATVVPSVRELNENLSAIKKRWQEVVTSEDVFSESEDTLRALNQEVTDLNELLDGATDEAGRKERQVLLGEIIKRIASYVATKVETPGPKDGDTADPVSDEPGKEKASDQARREAEITVQATSFQAEISDLCQQAGKRGSHPLCKTDIRNESVEIQAAFVKEAPAIIRKLEKELRDKESESKRLNDTAVMDVSLLAIRLKNICPDHDLFDHAVPTDTSPTGIRAHFESDETLRRGEELLNQAILNEEADAKQRKKKKKRKKAKVAAEAEAQQAEAKRIADEEAARANSKDDDELEPAATKSGWTTTGKVAFWAIAIPVGLALTIGIAVFFKNMFANDAANNEQERSALPAVKRESADSPSSSYQKRLERIKAGNQ